VGSSHVCRIGVALNSMGRKGGESGSHFAMQGNSNLFLAKKNSPKGFGFEFGMPSSPICQEGQGKKCGLGENPESWCIQKCKHQYKAMHNEQQTCLAVSWNLERLGFLLDCETGSLRCFGDSRFLHVFKGNFMDLVKPAFWILGSGGSVQFYF